MRMWFIAPSGQITSFGQKLHEWEKPLQYTRIVFGRAIKDEEQKQQLTKDAAKDVTSLKSDVTKVVKNSESCHSQTFIPKLSYPIEIRGLYK